MKIALIANLAGGVGRTSITHCLATAIAEYGKRTLAIDCDPSATLTFLSGIENPRFSTRELFDGEQKLERIAIKSSERFSIVPGASRLLYTEFSNLNNLRAEFNEFDFVLIDSPGGPSALIAPLIELADEVIIPVDGSIHSVRGALNLLDFIRKSPKKPEVRALENRAVTWDPELKANFTADFKLFEISISSDSALSESQLSTRSVLSEAPHSQISSDFRELAYLLLEEVGAF
jgi:cellulose biosynthesis protein BcsQ